MTLLYIGDIMGPVGIATVETMLPRLRQEHGVDLVIAQAENVTQGRGISKADYRRLKETGVDFFTGGNHIFDEPEIELYLNDPSQPIIRPANYPANTPGLGYKYVQAPQGKVLVISLLGQIVGRGAGAEMQNPLKIIDEILRKEQGMTRVATIVNFHGDFSSEKVIIGHYLDGRVSAVIGDHWHVPTADARVLPKGTAHISDVGMCGILNASLGVTLESVVPRWLDGKQTRNVLATAGERQFNAVLIQTDNQGLARGIEHLHNILPAA